MSIQAYLQIEAPYSVEDLKEFLGLVYGIEALSLIRILSGMTAWGYQVPADNGQKYFVKVIPWNKNLEEVNEEAIVVLNTLGEKAEITQVPQVIKTLDGNVMSTFNECTVIVFNYIEGFTGYEKQFSNDDLFKLGKLIGNIHKSTGYFKNFTNRENFETNLLDRGKMLEDALTDYSYGTIKSNVGELLVTVQERFTNVLKEFRELQKALKLRFQSSESQSCFVICHSDPTKGNFTKSVEGEIYLLDWDSPRLAPPELDIVCLHEYEAAMDGYRVVFPQYQVDNQALRFYSLCWTVDLILDHVPESFDLAQDVSEQNLDHLKRNLIEYKLMD